jgi:hypothetical protein
MWKECGNVEEIQAKYNTQKAKKGKCDEFVSRSSHHLVI